MIDKRWAVFSHPFLSSLSFFSRQLAGISVGDRQRNTKSGCPMSLKQRTKFRIVKWLLLLAVLAGALCLWQNDLEHRFFPTRFAAVEHGAIYRSGQISGRLIEKVLQENNISTVIDLTAVDDKVSDQAAEAKAVRKLNIAYFRLPMAGNGTGLLNTVADAVTELHTQRTQGQTVLVHCSSGAQRTGHILSAYLILVRKADPGTVYRQMQRYGWDPKTDSAWPEMLNANMRPLAQILVERGVIPKMPQPLPHFEP